MSERIELTFGWKLIIITLIVGVILLSIGAEKRLNDIRDLQRRVGQLEEAIKR